MKKMGKRWMALLLCALLTLGAPSSSLPFMGTVEVQAAKNGWVTKGKKTYYYVNGKKAKGITRIGSKLYAFNEKGVLQGKQTVFVWKNKYYKVSSKGVAKKWTGTNALAAKLIAQRFTANTAMKQLIQAFLFCASLEYVRVPTPAGYSEAKLVKYFGKIGLTEEMGDCSVQACSFFWLANVLGYNVKVINGYTRSTTYNEHSWVELTKGGKTYVCDPNFSKEYAGKISATGSYPLGMMIQYGAKNTLKYYRMDKTEITAGSRA